MTTPTGNQQGDEVLISSEKMMARLLERIWLALLLVSIFAGASSMMRFRVTGWLPVYSFHLSLAVFFWICFLFRRKLSYSARVGIILMIFYSIGIVGLYTFGMIGAGAWWLVLCTLQAKIFYSMRAGLVHAFICLLLIIVAGVGYTTGTLTYDYNLEGYITSVSTWGSLIFGCVFISMSIFSAISAYQRAVINLLRDVSQSKQKIQKQTEELDTLRGLLPICAQCKKIRDEQGGWENIEGYVEKNSAARFSHSLCPPCGKRLYGEVWDDIAEDIG